MKPFQTEIENDKTIMHTWLSVGMPSILLNAVKLFLSVRHSNMALMVKLAVLGTLANINTSLMETFVQSQMQTENVPGI